MVNKLGSAVGALALATSLEAGAQSAETQDDLALLQASVTVQQVDCVTHVKNEQAVRTEAGNPMSRRDMKILLGECRNANADARLQAQDEYIAHQEAVIVAQRETIQLLQGQLAANNMRLTESGQILDEYNRVVAELVIVGDQLAIQRRTNEDIAAQNAELHASIQAKRAESAQIKGRIQQLDAEAELLRADIAESQRNIDESRANINNMLDQAERILRSLSS